MTTEQLQSFNDLVNEVKFDGTSNITDSITTRRDNETIRTAGNDSEVLFAVNIATHQIALWLNTSEAMAVAASLMAQVMRIVDAKDNAQ